MNQPLTPAAHGVADYLSAATFAAAPALLGLRGTPARLAQGLGAAYAGMSLATDYPLGAVRKIPFTAHWTADAVLAPALAVAPWALGFSRDRRARGFFLAMAAVSAVVTTLTQRRPA
jgi:hypothetical protein